MQFCDNTEEATNKLNEDIRKFNNLLNMSRKCIQINLSKMGLSIGQPEILYTIKHFSDFSQKEIAQICRVRPSTLSRSLDSLEKNGLIERHLNSDKRRTISLKLTPFGEEKLEATLIRVKHMHELIFGDISEEEAEQVRNVFAKILDRMELYYKTISKE